MISVCMATYNGEKYLREQLDSILQQLSLEDELVVSDDGSTDGTLAILQGYADDHANVRILKGPHKGVIKNFEHAIAEAQGDVIFLCDQDDRWMPGKIERVRTCFQDEHCFVAVHDARIVDEKGQETEPSFFSHRGSGKGFVKNIVKNSYIGCCMAFRAKMKSRILPIPSHIEMHDWWIGMLSEIGGHSVFIPDKLLDYRRHGGNVSNFTHYKAPKMIWNRVYLLSSLIVRCIGLAVKGKWRI